MSEAAPQQDVTQTDLTNDQLIDAFVKLRDKSEDMEADLKKRLAPVKEAMARIEAVMHKRLVDSGTDAFKTGSGTAFLKEQTSVTVKEWASQTLPFIIANNRWDLLEASVGKKATLAHMEANGGNPPPGVKFTSRIVCQIRRGKDSE